MKWDKDLFDKQREAAGTDKEVVLLLAGPGTGKTFTINRRILYLINEKNVNPKDICVITFTRAAASELKHGLKKELEGGTLPHVSTMHSFAFTELLKNSSEFKTLPLPVRVADKWEEANIIFEDLKKDLFVKKQQVKELFELMSADWQTLDVDNHENADEWAKQFSEPRFIHYVLEHKKIYRYTVTNELVYQFKRLLENKPDTMKNRFKYLIVDEYQDLNKCDLTVIKHLVDSGMNLFACGDDDQSIYSFRHAHPSGIRNFDKEYVNSKVIDLDVCKRCGEEILDLGFFVAGLDQNHIKKKIISQNLNKTDIKLLEYADQDAEADGIAKICKHLIDKGIANPKEIFILLKINPGTNFSTLIANHLHDKDIKSVLHGKTTNVFEKDKDARCLLTYLRLIVNIKDDLALRTIMKLQHGCAENTIAKIHGICKDNDLRFGAAVEYIAQNHREVPIVGKKIKEAYEIISKRVQDFQRKYDKKGMSAKSFLDFIEYINAEIGMPIKIVPDIMQYVQVLFQEVKKDRLEDLFKIEDVLKGKSEEEDKDEILQYEDAVRIMTMHGAKGLTAKAVIIAGCEDELMPGMQNDKNMTEEKVNEQIRLLYVSITRAKNYLYLTFCKKRSGKYANIGSKQYWGQRSLSRFLKGSILKPKDGRKFADKL